VYSTYVKSPSAVYPWKTGSLSGGGLASGTRIGRAERGPQRLGVALDPSRCMAPGEWCWRVVSQDQCRITRQITSGGTPAFRSRSPQDRRRSWAVGGFRRRATPLYFGRRLAALLWPTTACNGPCS